MKTIHVNASGEYDILIGNGLLKQAGERICDVTGTCTAVIVSDDTVAALYAEPLKDALLKSGFATELYTFPHGEKSKTLATYGDLLEFLCERRITRKDIIVALGGGVTGDLAGFAAATYQRGIRCIQIPTTLLACVDSSVGGKTAVDLKAGKNQAGCFYQPSLVLIDPELLETLPEEEYRCGCAEVIKYAVIGDREFFEELMNKDIREMPEHVITTCVSMKRDIVEKDEFDTGERMLLNFGHTFGHAAEACSGYRILHGQAVAMGMAVMARSAAAYGICPAETVSGIEEILKRYRLPDEIPYPAEDLIRAAMTDKKMTGKAIRIVVPEQIGKCRIETIPSDTLKERMIKGGVKC